MKETTAWFCSECGNEYPRWSGKCPACGAWNTLVEQRKVTGAGRRKNSRPAVGTGALVNTDGARPQLISEIDTDTAERIAMPSGELNRVLGGGLVPGSMVLIGGEPGIGKSTLVLQNILSIRSRRILYVSGEESPQQIRMRADRIGRAGDNCYLVTETSLEGIFNHIETVKPELLIVDSIQTIASEALESSAGSVGQVRECAAQLLRYAKGSGTPVILIGHITKEGFLAGPKVLEHIVDAVLQFEGDSQYMYRILRASKNRFGNTSELGIYEMCQRGLREVTNPSELLLQQATGADTPLSGTAVGVTLEGIRPFLIEAQALVSTAAYGTPQRSVTGFDAKRLNMLLAVLEKRMGFRLAQKDVFLNIAGGLKVADPALDLAVIAAVLSSNFDIPLPPATALAGEVGLSGELRPAARMEQRVREAQRLGMTQIILPRGSLKGVDLKAMDIAITEAATVAQAFRDILKK